MDDQQLAKRRANDRERQRKHREALTPEQRAAAIQRKGDARRLRMLTDPAYAERYRAGDRERNRLYRAAAERRRLDQSNIVNHI